MVETAERLHTVTSRKTVRTVSEDKKGTVPKRALHLFADKKHPYPAITKGFIFSAIKRPLPAP